RPRSRPTVDGRGNNRVREKANPARAGDAKPGISRRLPGYRKGGGVSPRARLAIGIASELSALACAGASGATALAGPGEAAGKVKYRLDAATYFDPYARESAWISSHLDLIKAYPPAGDALLSSGVPVIGYHDIATEGFAPLSEASIQSYVGKVKRDASAGYAGTFLDDINWSLPYRDWS